MAFTERKIGPYSKPYCLLHQPNGSGPHIVLKNPKDVTLTEIADPDVSILKLARFHMLTVRHHLLCNGKCSLELFQGPSVDPLSSSSSDQNAAKAEGELTKADDPFDPPEDPKCIFNSFECPPYEIECDCNAVAACVGGQLVCVSSKRISGDCGQAKNSCD